MCDYWPFCMCACTRYFDGPMSAVGVVCRMIVVVVGGGDIQLLHGLPRTFMAHRNSFWETS